MVVFVAPYPNLKDLADVVMEDLEIRDGVSLVGNLAAGVKIAADYLSRESTPVFISRGGTAEFIRSQLKVPVVEIQLSYLDILLQFKKISEKYSKIKVVGFKNLTTSIRAISEILGYSVEIFTIKKEQELPLIFNKIYEEEESIILADYISYTYALNANLKCILFESGYESVKEAILKAQLIESSLKEQSLTNERFKAILNTVREGVLYTNEYGKITQVNAFAAKLLGKSIESLLNMTVFDLFPTIFDTDDIASTTHDTDTILIYEGNYLAIKSTCLKKEKKRIGMVLLVQQPDSFRDVALALRDKIKSTGFEAKYNFEDIIWESVEMEECIKQAKEYSKSLCNIIIFGETGTGKEMFAQSIHNESSVKSGPFVPINCAAFPIHLLESELFGYVDGAFSGARKGGKVGLFEIAHGGTLFLDEIGEMNIELQTKLLRVLQEKEIRRIGGEKTIPINVRIIVATNANLTEAILEKNFRKDLFYRLNVLDLNIPPLRDRSKDILLIFNKYLLEGSDGKIGIDLLSDEFKLLLNEYRWPGNVRELENIASRFIVYESIEGSSYAEKILSKSLNTSREFDAITTDDIFEGTFQEISERIIKEVFEQEGKNISKTAKRLELDRNTVRKKLS